MRASWASATWVRTVGQQEILMRIGLAMATNLQKHLSKSGYPPLIVWNRTASRADALQSLGALVASSVEDAVSKSSIIFSCVRPPFHWNGIVDELVISR